MMVTVVPGVSSGVGSTIGGNSVDWFEGCSLDTSYSTLHRVPFNLQSTYIQVRDIYGNERDLDG